MYLAALVGDSMLVCLAIINTGKITLTL